MSTPRQQQGGLSITTLAISAAASVAAAVVVHEVWKGGAILGAAITPVVVAIVSESLRKPVDRVSAIREQRRGATGTLVQPAPVRTAQPREDRFGIWQDDRLPWWQRRSTKLALLTGLLAFVIGGFALTASELVFGGSVGSGGRDTTLVGGGGGGKKQATQDEAPATATQETTPPATTETTPALPPGETAPAPTPTETTPAPAPTDTVPAPAPTETTPPAPAPTPPPEPETVP